MCASEIPLGLHIYIFALEHFLIWVYKLSRSGGIITVLQIDEESGRIEMTFKIMFVTGLAEFFFFNLMQHFLFPIYKKTCRNKLYKSYF